MQDNLRNRARRGRPTLAETAERKATPPPAVIDDAPIPRIMCSRCGHKYIPKVYRTLEAKNGEEPMRIMLCNGCGYAHSISPELYKKLR